MCYNFLHEKIKNYRECRMKKELEKYFVIADTVQEMNGDICEVILHELTKSGSYVAYVAN